MRLVAETAFETGFEALREISEVARDDLQRQAQEVRTKGPLAKLDEVFA